VFCLTLEYSLRWIEDSS